MKKKVFFLLHVFFIIYMTYLDDISLAEYIQNVRIILTLKFGFKIFLAFHFRFSRSRYMVQKPVNVNLFLKIPIKDELLTFKTHFLQSIKSQIDSFLQRMPKIAMIKK